MRGAGRKGVRGGFLQAKPATARSTAGCTAGCTAHMAALYRMYITVGLKAHTRPLVSASSAGGGGGGAGRQMAAAAWQGQTTSREPLGPGRQTAANLIASHNSPTTPSLGCDT